jgi:hypothetical protein
VKNENPTTGNEHHILQGNPSGAKPQLSQLTKEILEKLPQFVYDQDHIEDSSLQQLPPHIVISGF